MSLTNLEKSRFCPLLLLPLEVKLIKIALSSVVDLELEVADTDLDSCTDF